MKKFIIYILLLLLSFQIVLGLGEVYYENNFETSNLTGWNTQGSGTVSIDTNNITGTNNSLKYIMQDGTTAGNAWYDFAPGNGVSTNTTVHVTVALSDSPGHIFLADFNEGAWTYINSMQIFCSAGEWSYWVTGWVTTNISCVINRDYNFTFLANDISNGLFDLIIDGVRVGPLTARGTLNDINKIGIGNFDTPPKTTFIDNVKICNGTFTEWGSCDLGPIFILNNTYNMTSDGGCDVWQTSKSIPCNTTNSTPTVEFDSSREGNFSIRVSNVNTSSFLYNDSFICNTTGGTHQVCTVYNSDELIPGSSYIYVSGTNRDTNTTSGPLHIIKINTPPVTNDVFINSTDGGTELGDLLGSCNITDTDLLNVTFEWAWYNDLLLDSKGNVTIENGGGLANVANISSNSTLGFENWTFKCRGYDGMDYSNWLNDTITITPNTQVNSIYVTPIYPVDADNLSCNFNVTNNISTRAVNVSVTWYRNNTLFPGYNYTFNNVTNGLLYTTTNNTGSLLSNETTNYDNWKCKIDVVNEAYSLNNISQGVNLYPLENLTIYFPPDNYTSKVNLTVNFSVVDFDGGINCSLNIDNQTINSTPVTNETIIYRNLTYTPTSDGHYDWNISCTAIGNPIPLESNDRIYIHHSQGPTFTNLTSDETIFFPEVNDTITLSAIVNDEINIDSCILYINDTGSFVANETQYINQPGNNYSLNMTYLIPPNRNTNVSWYFDCNDTIGNIGMSTIQNFTVKDFTLPYLIIGGNNGFSTDNLTVVSGAVENLFLNLTFFDYNLFQASVNISCDINGSIYYWEELNITNITYNLIDSVNLSNTTLQKCDIDIKVSDDHTAEEIKEYKVNKKSDGLEFETDSKTKINILDKDKKVKDTKTEKLNDRQTFEFEFDNLTLERTFIVSTDIGEIYYRPNNLYPAQFVIWNKETSTGNWLDFAETINTTISHYKYGVENPFTTYKYEVIRINEKEFEVTIKARIPENEIIYKNIDKKSYKEKDIENYDELLQIYGFKDLKFYSIGGVNIQNLTFSFYIGGAVYTNATNIYDGTSISNFSVNIVTVNSFPGYDGIQNITGTEGYLVNLSNGTYNLTFIHSEFFSQTSGSYNVVNLTHTLSWYSYQSILNFAPLNLKTQEVILNWNITLNNTDTGQSNFTQIINGSIATFYVNAGNYTYHIEATGYDEYTATTNVSVQENKTVIDQLSFLATLNLYDEFTLGLFNVSSPDEIRFLLICPNSSSTTTIDNTTTEIPIDCNYIKFKISLFYAIDVGNYYRTFLLEPDDALNMSVYLIDLATTRAIYNSFKVDDLYSLYENISIYIKKNINDETVQITADFVDIENKIGAYLIENNEYIVEIHSDNLPVRTLGHYAADIAGDKSIRLYDISLESNPSGFSNAVSYSSGIQNASDNNTLLLTTYTDEEEVTTSVTWNVYSGSIGGTLIHTETNTAQDIEFTYNTTGLMNQTLYTQLVIDYLGETKHYNKLVNEYNQIAFPVVDEGFITQEFLDWVILILLSIILIMATKKSGVYVSLIVGLVAGLFVLFNWFTAAGGLIALGILISILVTIKKGDRDAK